MPPAGRRTTTTRSSSPTTTRCRRCANWRPRARWTGCPPPSWPATSRRPIRCEATGRGVCSLTTASRRGKSQMKKMLSVADLARDSRFERIRIEDAVFDPRNLVNVERAGNQFRPSDPESPDAARALMHGIFVGEIQALEGAGRTCYDFEVGDGEGEVPCALKLDMARQCWDEARHVEISIKLTEHMGSEIGEFSEQTMLFEAACNADPILRLTGVNRALEGLAIDVFNGMRDFGNAVQDPVLFFCEDWMLADEVTHVKMGSDWLRRLTVNDKERQKN